MGNSHRCWDLYEAARRRLYTWVMRRRFAAWGEQSLLEPSARLRSPHLVEVGRDVYLCENLWLNAHDDGAQGTPTLRIGDGCYIGRSGQINAWREVVIESHVLIADRVFISDADHVFEDTNRPIRVQGARFKGAVRLEQGCWLGVGVVVLPGVTIGKNAIVGANSVVTKSVPAYAIVAGVPAKIIRFQQGEA